MLHLQGNNSAKNLYLILKCQHQANNLVKVSNTNTHTKTKYKNCFKDNANRPKSTAEVQNKLAILIKM